MSCGLTNKCFPPANKCINCNRKGHDERPGRVGNSGREYKRCAGCRLMTYCDQDCQREHWVRVHKHHCRFLQGRKKLENSEHNPETCALCVEKRKSCCNEMFSVTSPKMYCHVEDLIKWMKEGIAATFGFHSEGKTCSCSSTSSWPGHLPFSFGEVSGHYIGEGRDEMMSHALKLALAMQLKAKDKNVEEELGQLILIINERRLDLWSDLLVYGRILSALTIQNEALTNVIDRLKRYLDASNPWFTALRFSLLVVNNIEVYSNLPPTMKTDLLEKCKDDPRFKTLKQVIKYDESQYKNAVFASRNNLFSQFKVWPKLLNKSLVLLLPSALHCQTCKDKVDGQFSLAEDEDLLETHQYPQWLPSIGINGSCMVYCSLRKNPNCATEGVKENVRRNIEFNKDQWKVYVDEYKLFIRLSRFCDECSKRSIFSHRCSACHAAQYCSKQCQNEDLDFHKSVCSKWAKDESKTLGSSREQQKYWKSVTDKAQKKQ